jgi:putative chitinase
MDIDRESFAEECVRQGVFFRIEPHYIMGVAELRSGIADDSNGNDIGPFRLTQALWDANRQNDEFDVHFDADEITSWRRQCVVFGLMASKAFDAFVAANNRNPSASELYLHQWSTAAAPTFADAFQKALDDTAGLVDPASDAVLDDPQSVAPIDDAATTTTGPSKRVGPDPVLQAPAAGGPQPPAGGQQAPAAGGQQAPAAGGQRTAAGGGLLTLTMLKRNWKRADPDLIRGMAATSGILTQFGINTPLRLAHFMAQISEESGSGTEMTEKLDYTAGRMMQVFPKRFPDMASTAGFAHNERAFGNKVYNGRMGNRLGSNDGFNFRGRGCLQITGRDSYAAIGRSVGLDLINNPQLVNDPQNVLLIAGTEFVKLGCLAECDRNDVVQVSARINLGHRTNNPRLINGLDQREAQLAVWKKEFAVA